MKSIKAFLSLITATVIMFAVSVIAYALDFNAEEIYDSVFVIYSGNSMGSGFAIGENCIVTNAHVIDDVNNITVSSYNETEYEGFVFSINNEADIALIGVQQADFSPLSMSTKVEIGDDVYAIGAPNSMSYTLTKGVVSSKNRKIGKYDYIQTDAAINEGNSGGPLINKKGEVIGINTLKMMDSEGIGLAIPMQQVIQYISSLGIELNPSEGINFTISQPDHNINNNENSGYDSQNEETNNCNHSTLYIILTISVLGNIILVLYVMALKRNKKANTPYSECTDFEIDILE